MGHLRKVSPIMKLDLKSSPIDIRVGISKPQEAKNYRSGRVECHDQQIDNLKAIGRE